jgi:large repetitive protein
VLLACVIALPGQASADDPAFNISNASALESAESASVVFAVTDGTEGDELNYSVTDVNTSGADFSGSRTGKASIGADGNATIAIGVVNDSLDEVDETFNLKVWRSDPAVFDEVTGTIQDDDAQPYVTTIADDVVTEGGAPANIVVTLSAVSGKTIEINFSDQGGTATASADYTTPTPPLTIAAGQLSGTIAVPTKQDAIAESEETVLLNFFGHTNVDPGPPGQVADVQAKVTIKDDGDTGPAPSIAPAAVPEGNAGLTDLTFKVTLPSPRSTTTRFNYRTVAETANGSDYTEVGGATLVFDPTTSTTSTVLDVVIKIKADTLDEPNETLKLELLNPTSGSVVASAVGTITNDDNNSKLSIGDATADEPGTMKFTVTLAPASGREVKVNWATADGTANAPADYTAGSAQLTFAPGETTKTIDIAVAGDIVNEENETLKVVLSGPTGVPPSNLTDAEGAGTIIDKNAPPSLSISDTTTREGVGADFVVTLAGTTLRTVTVRFETADGTAQAGSDYSARVGTLTFVPGEKTKTISVTVLDDGAAEFIETFSVSLGDPVNATITKSRGTAVIDASDQPASLQGGSTPPTTTPPTTTPPTTPTPPAGTKTEQVPRMILGPRTVLIGANGIAKMQVNCQKLSPIVCAGTVELERAAKPLLKLGKKPFSVKRGIKAYASIKLSARAVTLLRKNKSLRVKVVVLVKTSTQTRKVLPGFITLKATTALLKAKPPAPPPPKVVVDP